MFEGSIPSLAGANSNGKKLERTFVKHSKKKIIEVPKYYSAFRNFFPKFCLILKNRFLVRLSSNFQERLFMPSSSPEFFFGGVIFKITAEFRFFSPFPWKRSIHNSFFTNFV